MQWRLSVEMKKILIDLTSGYCELPSELSNSRDIVHLLVKEKKDGNKKFRQVESRSFFGISISSEVKMQQIIESLDMSFNNFIVRCKDWKVIPVENLIAYLSTKGKHVYMYAEKEEDLDYCFSILERGVDGVVVTPELALKAVNSIERRESRKIELKEAEIVSVEDAGDGDRVCVDTTSIFSLGEGLLAGSFSNFLFLVHSETLENNFVPTRPFRVNAGAVCCYVLSDLNSTKYLSELGSNSKILAVSKEGSTRLVTVGRVKIERRPMVAIYASADGLTGSIILQRAETVRLVTSKGVPVAVTSLKKGERLLVHTPKSKGRHMGLSYDEFVIER